MMISLPTASTLQVLNTSSISCHCFCFPHLLTYSVNTSSSQHFQHFLPLLLFPTSPYLQRQHFKFSTLPAFLVIASVSHISLPTASTLQVLNTSSIRFLSFFCFPHLLNYLQRQHFKFSTLPTFLAIASVSHISLPTASTLQVLNTSSISCQLLFLTSPYLQRQHFSSSQHFSTLPAFLVITSAISHISLPQILQQSLSLPC